MSSYGDYCPIAVATEIVGDRWSPLVLREIMIGSHRFNDIHRGIPRISRSLLAQRLRALERAGIVERRADPSTRTVEYRLTGAGADLQPILFGLGSWATRWVFGDPTAEQLDTAHLVWRLHQCTNGARVPRSRTTVEFRTRGPGGGHAWIVFQDGASTACEVDPGYEPDLVVDADNRELHRWFVGRRTWRQVCDAGAVTLIGPRDLVRGFPTWFVPSAFHGEVSAAVRGRRARAAS